MKLFDSFSIDPIMNSSNEGRDDTAKEFPNLEKLYSPISIDTSLELLYIWNSLSIISGLSSLQNELLPILNEINSGKLRKRTSLVIDLKQLFPISIVSKEGNVLIENFSVFLNESSPIIIVVKLSRAIDQISIQIIILVVVNDVVDSLNDPRPIVIVLKLGRSMIHFIICY